MRRVIYADSFVDDADRIAEYIESRFGIVGADAFIGDLNHFCRIVAEQPGIGKQGHGYKTTLYGVVHDQNRIFFEYDDEEIRFVHIVEGVRHKPIIKF